MPILDVEIITRPNEILSAGLAVEIANGAAEIFQTPPGNTWVKLKTIPSEQYAENGLGQVEAVYPVFVAVLKARLPPQVALHTEAAQLAGLVSKLCSRPVDNVHILYQPEGAGRIAFGGNLVSAE